ncbi:MAG: hypothetical protein K2J32_01565, partial [Ruminococcus sp.]|nr:hypothetical protein [Ruminococcus sp.]
DRRQRQMCIRESSIYNNWLFLDRFYDIIKKTISSEIILYSEYYWATLFINAYYKKYNTDYSGFEQCHFKIIDRIEHTLGNVDIALLERIELSIDDKII